MSRIHHLQLDVQGAIQGTGWKCVSSPDGRPVKKAEAIAWLLERLAEGKRLLPLGPCEGFDYQKGCPGHGNAECPNCKHDVSESTGQCGRCFCEHEWHRRAADGSYSAAAGGPNDSAL